MAQVLRFSEDLGDSMSDLEELKLLYEGEDVAAWHEAIGNVFPAIVARLEAAQRLRDAAKTAPNILEHMIMTSENGKCPPLHYLLTHEGLYGFHMANLWVRNDGKEYTISADWADNCGRLVKHLTEALAAFDKEPE